MKLSDSMKSLNSYSLVILVPSCAHPGSRCRCAFNILNANDPNDSNAPNDSNDSYFVSFLIYASSLSFSYFTVLRNRLSSR